MKISYTTNNCTPIRNSVVDTKSYSVYSAPDGQFSHSPATPTQNDVVNKDSQPPYAPAASDAVCVPRSTPSLAKKKRIRFTEAWDLLLLKAVTASDAHVAPHGKTGKRFEQALKLFLDAAPSSQLVDITRPVPKTLRDRFTTIVEKRRVEVRGTAAASGIVEKRGQREELLDDVILAMDEEQERKNALINERTEKEKQLNDAGEAIRAKAVTRMQKQQREDREEDCGASDSDKSSPVAFKKVRKRVFSTDSDDDEKDAIQEEIKLR
ncbi:hypothetical protein BWQ96_08776 [Gracilariopsis chorda]|uniref:Uncharacterized protein n=1 Tax=Gracilariopsis chorda TaxID=448386 RepID=A0A2V3IK68_9FLOR|nr:hypothetical protein BWQ96_08776 [Gracilariopsis chorda]|eukprot:PXF41520.1 hypothetical protein BWQ96_08776 [Gracilariopsis chorda]